MITIYKENGLLLIIYFAQEIIHSAPNEKRLHVNRTISIAIHDNKKDRDF